MTYSLALEHLKRAYDTGTLTPEKVIDDIYAKIAAAGERPVWISLFPKEAVLAKLKAAPKGPLWGIPFAVKDNIDVKGLPTTCACPEFAYDPARSATVVEKLEAAGALPIGKTNLDQFATGLNGTRSPYGVPSSVFSKDHISGGSSSGSAVAVAAGLVSFSLGTDTAGSGRVPAGFNNIVGLKPTKGLFSTRGLVPACRTQDVISIFALTATDAAAVAGVAQGFDAEDPYSRCAPVEFAPMGFAPGLRVGVPKALEFFGDQEAEALYWTAVETLKSLGAEIVSFDLTPFLEAANLLYSGPWVAERYAACRTLADPNPEAIIEPVRSIILGGKKLAAADAFEGFYKLADLIRKTEPTWAAIDVMLVPTSGTTYTIKELQADPVALNTNLGRYTNFVNLMDLAAFALPAGFRPNGLPFGVTLIGQAFTDGKLAVLADRLHRASGDSRLGATETKLSETIPLVPPASKPTRIQVAVVGAHLKGQPLNWQLTERHATLVKTTKTAPGYSLYALPGTVPPKPGLVYDGTGKGLLEIEIWEMDMRDFGSFVSLIPQPLGIGTIKTETGDLVKSFIAEGYAVDGAEDITHHGGWRTWLKSRA